MAEVGNEEPQRRGKGLLAQAANFMAAGVVTAVLGYGTVMVLTRLLTPAEYGVFTLVQAIAALAAATASLSFAQASSRFYLEDETAFPAFLKTITGFLLLLNALVVAAVWLARGPAGELLEMDGMMVFLGVLVGVLRVPWALLWKTMVAQRRAKPFARLSVARDIALMLCTVGGAVAGYRQGGAEGSLWGAASGLAIGSALVAGYSLLWIGRQAGGRSEPRFVTYALRFGGPLVPATVAGAALNFIDRALIQNIIGAEGTGQYAFAYNIGLVMNLGMLAALQAFHPVFIKHREQKDLDTIVQGWRRMGGGLLALGFGLVALSREVAIVLGGQRFLGGLDAVPWVVVGYLVRAHAGLFAQYAIFHKRTELNAAGTILAAISNVVLNLWLIPDYGLVAAAWTTFLSFLILMVWNLAVARFVLKERVVPTSTWGPPVLVGVVGLPLLHAGLGLAADHVWLLVGLKALSVAAALGLLWRVVLRR